MSTVTITLTPEQANALIEMADYGIDERAYSLGEETRVSIGETDDEAFEAEIADVFADDDFDTAYGYTADDLREIRDTHKAAIEAFHIINAALGRPTQT